MGIRETLNENPRLTTGITAGIIAVTLIWILWSVMGSGATPAGGDGGQAFFTDDDGKTWFADDANKIPPFDHNGKEAVRAHVYKCDGKTFVNHMERYTPEAKKRLEQILAKGNTGGDPTLMDTIHMTGLQYKSPGQKEWIRASDHQRATAVLQPKCSKPSEAELVTP